MWRLNILENKYKGNSGYYSIFIYYTYINKFIYIINLKIISIQEKYSELSYKEIIEGFEGLYFREDINEKIKFFGLELEENKKEEFILYIQNTNVSSGGIVKISKLEGIFKPEGIDSINEIFTFLQDSFKNRVKFLNGSEDK